MISTNALYVFLLSHHLNGPGNKNLLSIQDVMRASKPAAEKFKRVCEDFPNLAILTKSATPGEIQLTFGHVAVGNKSLGESVVAFALVGDLSSPSVTSELFPRGANSDLRRNCTLRRNFPVGVKFQIYVEIVHYA